jgi:hypothetical protein
MTEEKVKNYKKIISQYWKFFNESISNDFGTDAMWSKAVNDSGELQRSHGCEISKRIAYILLDEMNRLQKSKEDPDIKIYYNVFLDCGNSLSQSNDWNAFNDYLRFRYKKYNGMRFAEKMFDVFQTEIAKEFDWLTGEKDADNT